MVTEHWRVFRDCFDYEYVADDVTTAVVVAVAEAAVDAASDAAIFVQSLAVTRCCLLHWTWHYPSACHSTAFRSAADHSVNASNPIVHSTMDLVLMLLLWYSECLHCFHSDEIDRFVRKRVVEVSSCEAATVDSQPACLQLHLFHCLDASTPLSTIRDHDGRRGTHSRATYFSVEMEGHFDCKLIAGSVSNCEVVICPSMEICRSCKASSRRVLKYPKKKLNYNLSILDTHLNMMKFSIIHWL